MWEGFLTTHKKLKSDGIYETYSVILTTFQLSYHTKESQFISSSPFSAIVRNILDNSKEGQETEIAPQGTVRHPFSGIEQDVPRIPL